MSRARKLILASLALLVVTMGVSFDVHYEKSSAVETKSAARPSQVAVIGDSLAWQADASIVATLSGAGYRAEVSVNPGHALSSSWAQSELRAALKDPANRILVLETASNDAEQVATGAVPLTQYAELLNTLLQSAQGRCVVIVNAKEDVFQLYYSASDAGGVDATIEEAARQDTSVREVDWDSLAEQHPSWFGPDLLHLAPGLPAVVTAASPPTAEQQTTADVAFAKAITAGVESCRS
jgi:hypothetical protein